LGCATIKEFQQLQFLYQIQNELIAKGFPNTPFPCQYQAHELPWVQAYRQQIKEAWSLVKLCRTPLSNVWHGFLKLTGLMAKCLRHQLTLKLTFDAPFQPGSQAQLDAIAERT
jgi:hypothetical protein